MHLHKNGWSHWISQPQKPPNRVVEIFQAISGSLDSWKGIFLPFFNHTSCKISEIWHSLCITTVGHGRGNCVGYLCKNLEKLLVEFLRKVAKTSFLALFGQFWPFSPILHAKSQKWRKISKIRLDRFFGPKCPLLHAKFRKNCWCGFWETASDGRTEVIL